MVTFFELSDICQSLFALWTLLLCCMSIAGIVLALSIKRKWYAFFGLAVFILSYFLWQVTFSLRNFGGSENNVVISIRLGNLPLLCWIFVLILLSFFASAAVVLNIRYMRCKITPLSIKYCADKMPCGICFWRDNGHVIFSNNCMNSLCITLSGNSLMNGNSFYAIVSDGIHSDTKKTWNFIYRKLMFEDEPLHEMIAWDVTEIYEKSEILRHDNEELSKVNEELRAYSQRIDETVRRQEILQAKVNIHDEMNRLMLSTIVTDVDNTQEMNRILSLWEQNALILCMESDAKKIQNAAQQLEKLANTLNIRLTGIENLPDLLIGKQRELFFTAAREAIINAVKHGAAKNMRIAFENTESNLCCFFENDGIIPKSEICFTGGLDNLSLLAKEQNAFVTAEIGKVFKLTLCFQK